MKKILVLISALTALCSTAFAAAPSINFATATFTPGSNWPSFNASGTDNTSFADIAVSGFTYNSGIYRQDQGYLWLRKNTNDNGLGYCAPGVDTCGATNTTGGGDYNELDNAGKNEVIRLAKADNMQWSDIWVSSLDDGGTNGNETGTFYWSNSATPTLTGGIVFSHDSMFVSSSVVEGSIFNYLVSNGFDVNSKYVFFRAGSYDSSGTALNGTNNDFLVYGVGVTPVPEPEIYAMMGLGLGLLGWVGRRKKRQVA